MKYRTLRALKTMKELPGFSKDFSQFVREECRREADLVLSEKDPPLKNFNMDSIKDFSFESSLSKLERVAPTLLASIAGSISESKCDDLSSLSRKGFGGRRRDESVSLVPAIVQTASAILRNRHPNSISTVPAVNSLNNWTSHITSRYFYLANALGTSFRFLSSSFEYPEKYSYGFLFSQKKTVQLIDKVNEAHALKIEEMRDKVETMLRSSRTNRERSARASAGAFGFSMFGDNVGKVINPRFVLLLH